MTFNNLYFHVGLFLFTTVSFCHTKQCFSKKQPCISEFKLWTLDANRQGFVEVSLPAQSLISQYSVKLMSKTSMYDVQLFEDPYRNRKYAMCNIALGEDVDDHQPWAIVLLGRGTIIDGVIYTFNYSDSRAQALAKDTGLDDNVLVDNKSLSLSRCGSSYVQSFPTMWEDNDCPTYTDVFTEDDSVDEMEDEPDVAASPAKRMPHVAKSTGITNNKITPPRMPEKKTNPTRATDKHLGTSLKSPSSTKPSSTSSKTNGVVTHRSTQPSKRQHTSESTQPTAPRSSVSTKQPTLQPKHKSTSTSSSASTQPTSLRSSASTKYQSTSTSSSASAQPTSPRHSASTKHEPTSTSSSASTQPTSPRSSASTKHQPTSTSSSASTQPTSPRHSTSTKHEPFSTSSSASTQPTSPRSSASTKHQPTSTSSSASTKPTAPRSSASTKQPTSPSSHSPNATEHGPTETSRTEVSSSSSGSTSSVSMTASSPSTSSSTVAPFLKEPVINEVSILVGNDVNNSSIELRGPNMTLDNFSLVVFDGNSMETLFHKRFGEHEVINGSGVCLVGVLKHHQSFCFLIQKHNHTANDSSVAVALYDNSKWLQHYTDHVPINQIHGLVDSFIVRTTEEDIHTDILENLVPQSTKRIFTVNPSLISGRSNVSISRCKNDTKDPGSFILAPSTIGQSNNCTTGYGNRVQFKLSNANCEEFRSNKALQQSLVDVIVNSVNDKCKCGLSQVLVKKRKYTCGSLIFEAYLESSFPWQSHLIFHGFRNFVHTSKTVIVGPRSYITDSTCFQDCLPPATKPGSKGDDNVTLTVAVVVSCVGVFLIIAMSVIIYIRRKKRGIVTFRLTNLGELDSSGILHEDKDDLIDEDNATFRTISITS